jgi:hypothetical protein
VKLPFAALLLAALPAFAQISETAPDLILPGAGSTAGQGDAQFRTELQLTNPTDGSMGGWLVFRPGVIARRYEIAPRATLSYADIVAELGASGLGSIDLLADGAVVPIVVARAYDDQPEGTTGVVVPVVRPGQLLTHEGGGTLIVPRDLARYRFNIGIRTVDEARINIILRGAGGTEKHRRTISWPANHFEQQTGAAFAGMALSANDSIEIEVVSGSLSVYGTTVDNATNDSSLQLLVR